MMEKKYGMTMSMNLQLLRPVSFICYGCRTMVAKTAGKGFSREEGRPISLLQQSNE